MLAHARLGQLREVERRVDRGAERRRRRTASTDIQTFSARAERVSWMPRSEKLTSSSSRLGVGEVVGRERERAPQPLALAHEQAAALERLVEPLVRVERDRVGAARSRAAHAAPALGQRREAAVGARRRAATRRAARADLRQLGQRVDRAGVGRARADATTNSGARPRGDVGVHRAGEQVGAHAVARASAGSTRSWSGRKPSGRAARASDECAWSET